MNEEIKYTIIGLLIFLAFTFLGAILGYDIGKRDGFTKGYQKANDDTQKWNCQIKYGKEEQQYIPGECLKYFNKEE